MDVVPVGTTLPAGVTVGSPLANLPAWGGGLNAWLQSCNRSIPSSVAAGAWYNKPGQHGCVGTFFRTVGNVLIGPNSPYPHSAADLYGVGDTGDADGHFGLSSRHPGGAGVLNGRRIGAVPGRGDQLRLVLIRPRRSPRRAGDVLGATT